MYNTLRHELDDIKNHYQLYPNRNASKNCVGILPADPLHMALFITEMTSEASSKGTTYVSLEAISYTITWVHNMCSLISPTNSAVVKVAFQGAKRWLARPIAPKKTLPIELIQKVATAYSGKSLLSCLRFL